MFLELDAQGVSRKEISKRLGMSPASLTKKIKDLGIFTPKIKPSLFEIKEYEALKSQGVSSKEIAKRFEISTGHLNKLVREHQIEQEDIREEDLRKRPIDPRYVKKLFEDGYDIRQVALILRVRKDDFVAYLETSKELCVYLD